MTSSDPPSGPSRFCIVGIGASAGGLDACRKLLSALPAATGMSFIIVPHLDPSHQSVMAALLAKHTPMTVTEAKDGMLVEPNHLYVIPSGTYLSLRNGALHVSRSKAPRLPFDFFLHSLAAEYGARAVAVVLSGTGSDGTLGLKSVKDRGGLVIVQDPAQAGYDGMPRSAIATGLIDFILPIAEISGALLDYDRHNARSNNGTATVTSSDSAPDPLPEIVELLGARTAHDFTHYKSGTLQRRIERRMAMASAATEDMGRYLEMLRNDADEVAALVQDLLINVTSFFRDPSVFQYLAAHVIPKLVRDQPSDSPLRIWIPGCSTGEEAYSLAMLFREEIVAAKRDVKLQIFASDVDPDAIAAAREGLYREASIEGHVSAERLARFFAKEDDNYRVLPELRAVVVFTVQDVLSDPPFSRIDMISCRNLLIYLRPEAQSQVISLFDFALREGGLLLLGNSETIGGFEDRFEFVSKSERLYRRIDHNRPGDYGVSRIVGDRVRVAERPGQAPPPSRQTALAELCQRLVMETFAPAAILVNHKLECLYFLGPTDRYLRVPSGHPTHDLLAMADQGMRIKFRAAIQQAIQDNKRAVVAGGQTNYNGGTLSFDISAQPVQHDGEEFLLICFLDDPQYGRGRRPLPPAQEDMPQIAALQQELEVTRVELHGAIRNLEISNEEQRAINEEALSVNEEYQSTNEELLASKEELQSLNEELTALNTQIHETLERQRTTANDLQNILYSTNIATLFLGADLRIRFFTPTTRSLFNLIPSDIGRPLSDLNPLAKDDSGGLLIDVQSVLRSYAPVEREIEGRNGRWYIRRISPYRAMDDTVDGVVITYTDTTERRHASNALESAKRQAEQANIAKSRFLAAASHDLRQPLQTLAMLQGLLAKMVDGKAGPRLIDLLNHTLGTMSGMLNTLLDINQIDAGIVQADTVDFSINELLSRLKEEFTFHAQAKGIVLHVMPCGLSIRSDPRLLEQMIRNLLSNALKYTERGKVLLGCRRHADSLSIEIWDTGIGIPSEELHAIFEEYHQLNNSARERSRGLGLGLAIVQRLGNLLGHRIDVRSRPGRGSAFAIDSVPLSSEPAQPPERVPQGLDNVVVEGVHRNGAILIVEDDPNMRDILELFLKDEGHQVAAAAAGDTALDLVAQGAFRPDIVLADYRLPGNLNGLQLVAKLRELLNRELPVIILTGDIATDTLRDIALENCVKLHKPVTPSELTHAIQSFLVTADVAPHSSNWQLTGDAGNAKSALLYIVDDDNQIREAIRAVLEEDGYTVEDYASCEAFLDSYRPGREACLLVDAYLPGIDGLELLRRLNQAGHRLPSVMITGRSDVPTAVRAMKAGASDFIEKPVGRIELLASIVRALEQSRDAGKLFAWREDATARIARLTPRERQIMDLVLAGQPSKIIAADLGISQRTVEYHRAAIMKKTGARSLPALARLALAAG